MGSLISPFFGVFRVDPRIICVVWLEEYKEALPTRTFEYSLCSCHRSSLGAAVKCQPAAASGRDASSYYLSLSLSLSGPIGSSWQAEGRRAPWVGMEAGEGEPAASPRGKVGLWGTALSPTPHTEGWPDKKLEDSS